MSDCRQAVSQLSGSGKSGAEILRDDRFEKMKRDFRIEPVRKKTAFLKSEDSRNQCPVVQCRQKKAAVDKRS